MQDYAVEVCGIFLGLARLVGMFLDCAQVVQGGGDGLADLGAYSRMWVIGNVFGVVGVEGGEFGLDL